MKAEVLSVETLQKLKKLEDYEKRINKAIEYINEAIEDTDIAEVINTNKLLNILKGE